MAEFVQDVIEAIGYPGIALLTFLENVFPPIPSEIVIPFSGFAAQRGELTLIGVTIAGTVGSLVGAVLFYYIGRQVSEERIMQWVDNHGQWLALSGEDVQRAEDWFRRRGQVAVFICRLIPGLRSLISIPAGTARMNMPLFLLWTVLGTIIWTAALAVLGYVLGQNYDAIQPYMDIIGWIVFIVIVVWIARWVWQRRQMVKRQEQSKSAGYPEDTPVG